jgi:glycosyltransferase involved in cell wall biosynthesis
MSKIFLATYPFAFLSPGGGEIQLMQYLENLNRKGISAFKFDYWGKNDLKSNVLHFFSVFSGSIEFFEHVKSLDCNVLVSPNLWVSPHNESDFNVQSKWLLHLSKFNIVNSRAEVENLSAFSETDKAKYRVVYNFANDIFNDYIDPMLFRNKFNFNEKFILNVANIEPRKNQLFFLKALESFPNFFFINVGYIRDNDYYQSCKNFKNFIHLGPIDNTSPYLRSAIAGCEFFAMPSLLETPSIAALEAAKIGKKILITEVGSTSEYFENFAIYLNPFSLESCKEGILQILNLKLDQNAFKIHQQKFSAENSINALIKIYNEIDGS